MTQTSETSFQPADTDEVRQQLKGKHVCPFCGVIRGDQAQPCPRCTMEDTLSTRQGTRQRIGPWYVMQARNPSAPGMKFATLVSLVKKGHVTPRSIVRGPTTHQLWSFAAKVRGLSRELGLCHHCGDPVEQTAATCAACGRLQEPPADPDVLMENQSGLPELNMTATTNPDTGLDSGGAIDTPVADLTGLTLSKSGRPPTPTINQLPAVGRPAQPPQRVEESILSARELAAAFQLDFKPKKPVATINRSVAAPAQVPPVPKPTPTPVLELPKPNWGKRIFIAIFLLLVAAGVAVGIKPEWRSQVASAFERFKTSLEKPAPTPTAPQNNTKPAVTPKLELKPIKPAQPVVINNPPPPSSIEVVESKPKEEPKIVKEEPKPAPPPVAKVEVKKPPVVEESYNDSNLTLDQATALAKSLRNQAIDAEDAGNWHQALNLYQRIEKLPQEAWPQGLKGRLEKAQSKIR